MHLLLDYRPALRQRTGVGEWVHELARAMGELRAERAPQADGLRVTLFSSSWRDRLDPVAVHELGGVTQADLRIPVRWLNRAWYRSAWPPVEWLARGRYDIVQATAPALLPSRTGLRAVTIYDLDFLHHPERAWGEMQSDFPRLVRQHAQRADLVVTISDASARAIESELGVPAAKIVRCRPGVPRWLHGQSARSATLTRSDAILFVGTLEPRKNIGGLLDAYERLLQSNPDAPSLVLAGRHTPAAEPWLARAGSAHLRSHVTAPGYVSMQEKLDAYRHAAVLVLPSFDEGFGLPALEAMAMGVPVVASRRGSLPEVVGDAAELVDPDDPAGIAAAIKRVLTEPGRWLALREAGLARAQQFDWRHSALVLLDAYRAALSGRGSL